MPLSSWWHVGWEGPEGAVPATAAASTKQTRRCITPERCTPLHSLESAAVGSFITARMWKPRGRNTVRHRISIFTGILWQPRKECWRTTLASCNSRGGGWDKSLFFSLPLHTPLPLLFLKLCSLKIIHENNHNLLSSPLPGPVLKTCCVFTHSVSKRNLWGMGAPAFFISLELLLLEMKPLVGALTKSKWECVAGGRKQWTTVMHQSLHLILTCD